MSTPHTAAMTAITIACLISACDTPAPVASSEGLTHRMTREDESELNQALADYSVEEGRSDGALPLERGYVAFGDGDGDPKLYSPSMWVSFDFTLYSCDLDLADCDEIPGPLAAPDCHDSGLGDEFCECDNLVDCIDMLLFYCERNVATWPDSGTITCNRDYP